jgi:hypothetical protein
VSGLPRRHRRDPVDGVFLRIWHAVVMTPASEMQRFPILFTGANRAMGILGLRPKACWVDVGDSRLVVHMSWAFRLAVPRSSVTRVETDTERVLGWGVHGWRGEWLVNGSSQGLVRVALDPPGPARMCGLPVSVKTLRVSLEDPVGFIETLR